MNDRIQSFHLLFKTFDQQSIDQSETLQGDIKLPVGFNCLEIPNGTSYLLAEDSISPYLAMEKESREEDLFTLEPVWDGLSPQLMIIAPEGRCTYVNGIPAPPLALLNIKDEITFNNSHEYVAHVSIFNHNSVVPPPDHVIGKQCPVCREKFINNTKIYMCSCCGQPLHSEDEDRAENRLNCTEVCSKCPICETPINLQPGFVYLPLS